MSDQMEQPAPPTPPLFRVEAPFEDMNGKKICVFEGDRKSVGELIVYRRPAEKLLGVRIDILGPLQNRDQFTIRYITLNNEATIRSIRATGDAEVPYAIKID
jgi:hypothetical protein